MARRRNFLGWTLMMLPLLAASCGGDDKPSISDSDTDSDTGSGTGSDTGTGTGTDTGTDSDTDTDTGSETGSAFACDAFSDAGCEADEKCGIKYWESVDDELTLACVDEGGHTVGERCTLGAHAGYVGRFDNCGSGLACFDLDDSGFPECRPICPCDSTTGCDSTVNCSATELCLFIVSPSDYDFPVGICLPDAGCDPVWQTGCAVGENCYVITGDHDHAVSYCARYQMLAGSDGTQGEVCNYVENCETGFFCDRSGGGDGRCRRFCDPEGDPGADGAPSPACGASEGTCTALTGYPTVGICPEG